jgi:hypothetical protein
MKHTCPNCGNQNEVEILAEWELPVTFQRQCIRCKYMIYYTANQWGQVWATDAKPVVSVSNERDYTPNWWGA